MDDVKNSELIVGFMNLLLLCGSVTVWSILFQTWRNGQPVIKRRFRSLHARVGKTATVLALAFVYVSVATTVQTLMAPPHAHASWSSASLKETLRATLMESLVVLPIMVVAVLFGARNKTDLVRLGFRKDHLGQQVKEGMWGCLAAFSPVFVLLLCTLPFRGEEPVHPFLKLLQQTGFGEEMVLIFFTAAVLAPLKEELIFRVVLQTWLTRWLPAWAGILSSSLIFAVVHGFPDCIPLIPLALILGTVYYYRRSYVTIVVLHALFNLINLIQMVVASS